MNIAASFPSVNTSGKMAIGGAPFWLLVAHMGCATNATPLVTVYWWRICHMRHA
jgi:hypothetical protein